RYTRRELEIGQAIRSRLDLPRRSSEPGLERRRVAVHAQQEVGIDEHPLERELNPRVKAAPFASSLREEWTQRLHICRRGGPPIRKARDLREDLRGAVALFRGAARFAHENGPAAWRVLRGSGT